MLYHWEFLRLNANEVASFYEAGIQRCPSGYRVYSYLPPKNILHFIISGRGTLYVGDQAYETHTGEGFFSPEHMPVAYYADDDDPWFYCWIHFDGTQLMEFVRRAHVSQSSPVFAVSDPGAAERIVRRIMDLAKNLKPEDEAEVYQLGYGLFASLLRDNPSPAAPAPPVDITRQVYFDKAIRYMRDHIHSDCTVGDVAAHLGLNANYFSTIFRDTAHLTPQAYMMLLKVDTARLMLIHTDKSVKEIARDAGYKSPAALTKAFTKVHGLSPREYRHSGEPADQKRDMTE